jgi:hypothetical protein
MDKIKQWFVGVFDKLKKIWKDFEDKNPKISQWVREGGLFLIISNVITFLRGFSIDWLTALLKHLNVSTAAFGWPNITLDIFGVAIPLTIIGDVEGEGLAATIGLWASSFIFEVINFFMQRKYTFRSNGNLWFQCPIYFLAWMVVMFVVNPLLVIMKSLLMGLIPGFIITVVASFLQGSISVVVMFFVNKIIFTDAPKQEELAK